MVGGLAESMDLFVSGAHCPGNRRNFTFTTMDQPCGYNVRRKTGESADRRIAGPDPDSIDRAAIADYGNWPSAGVYHDCTLCNCAFAVGRVCLVAGRRLAARKI